MTLLVDRLGAERAAAVIELAGGQRIAVPAELEDGAAPRALEKRFGRDLAIALVLHFGGDPLYIPRPRLGRAHLKDVVRLSKRGKSANFIARKLGCSDRAVYRRRAQARALGLLPTR